MMANHSIDVEMLVSLVGDVFRATRQNIDDAERKVNMMLRMYSSHMQHDNNAKVAEGCHKPVHCSNHDNMHINPLPEVNLSGHEWPELPPILKSNIAMKAFTEIVAPAPVVVDEKSNAKAPADEKAKATARELEEEDALARKKRRADVNKNNKPVEVEPSKVAEPAVALVVQPVHSEPIPVPVPPVVAPLNDNTATNADNKDVPALVQAAASSASAPAEGNEVEFELVEINGQEYFMADVGEKDTTLFNVISQEEPGEAIGRVVDEVALFDKVRQTKIKSIKYYIGLAAPYTIYQYLTNVDQPGKVLGVLENNKTAVWNEHV